METVTDNTEEYITEALISSLFTDGDNTDLEIISNAIVYYKSLIKELLEKRNVSPNMEASFDIRELIRSNITLLDVIKDFDINLYFNEELFKQYIDAKILNMSAPQVEDIKDAIKIANSTIREIISSYISKLNDNFIRIYYGAQKTEEPKEISAPVDDFDDGIDWDFDPIEPEEIPIIEPQKEISNEELEEYIKFLNVLISLIKLRITSVNINDYMFELVNRKTLEYYYSDPEFMDDLNAMMLHDTNHNTYYFHGTQCLEDAYSIIDQGLGSMRGELSSTTYKEFSIDELLSYHRGMQGEIGKEAIVIMEAPIHQGREVKILYRKPEHYDINFVGSGLQGFEGKANYIVPSDYIIGFVDKLHRKVIFNKKYYDYQRFSERDNNR